MTLTIWVWLERMHGYITQQRSNNDLSKLHRDSLCVLARLKSKHGLGEWHWKACKNYSGIHAKHDTFTLSWIRESYY